MELTSLRFSVGAAVLTSLRCDSPAGTRSSLRFASSLQLTSLRFDSSMMAAAEFTSLRSIFAEKQRNSDYLLELDDSSFRVECATNSRFLRDNLEILVNN